MPWNASKSKDCSLQTVWMRPPAWDAGMGAKSWIMWMWVTIHSCVFGLFYFLAIAREGREWMVTLPEALNNSSWKSCSLEKALWWECAERKLLASGRVCPLPWLSWGQPSPGLPSSWIQHQLIHCKKQKKKQEKTIGGFHGYWNVYFLLTVITNSAIQTSSRCRK